MLLESAAPKPSPCTVIELPPLVAKFIVVQDIAGASKLSARATVATKAATVVVRSLPSL